MADKYWVANKPEKAISTVAESGTAAGVDVGGMVKLSKTIAYADFTDGGAAVGTFTFGEEIPVGATYHATIITSVTAFTGNSSAVMVVGDGTVVDRYMTSTVNVFTAGGNGKACGVPSGLNNHPVAKAPVVTITKGSDWGTGVTGSVSLELWYLI